MSNQQPFSDIPQLGFLNTRDIQKISEGDIFSDVFKITPKDAENILKHRNKRNRKTSIELVDFLADQMEKGQWVLNGESIIFDKNGMLSDGQHRLSAVLKSGLSFSFFCVFNVSETAKNTIDTGKNRSFADVLSFDNIPNVVTVAATASKVMKFNEGLKHAPGKATGSRGKFSNQDGLDFLAKNSGFVGFIEYSLSLYRQGDKLLPPSSFCAFHWLISSKCKDETFVNDFFYKISTGLGLSEEMPVFALRKVLIQHKAKAGFKTRYRLTGMEVTNIFLFGWNKHREGKNVSLLKIPENTPEILS